MNKEKNFNIKCFGLWGRSLCYIFLISAILHGYYFFSYFACYPVSSFCSFLEEVPDLLIRTGSGATDVIAMEKDEMVAGKDSDDGIPKVENADSEIVASFPVGHKKDMLALARKGELAARSGGPSCFRIDERGHIYILDLFNLRLSHFDEKGNFIEMFRVPACETEDVEDLEYFSDMLLVKDGFIFLNNTSRNLLFFDGKMDFTGQIKLDKYLASAPLVMSVISSGSIFIRDEGDEGVLIDFDGKLKGKVRGYSISEHLSTKGYVFAFENDTVETIDLVGVRPAPEEKKIQSKLIARLFRPQIEKKLMAWKIFGTDSKDNVYVGCVEGSGDKTGEVEITVHRITPAGKILARKKFTPPPAMYYFPEREFVVSPAGDLYYLGGNENQDRFVLYRFKI